MSEGRPQVRRAGLGDLETVAALFDAYRQFYRQKPDLESALRFLRERFIGGDSHILLAEADGTAAGFAQLYPVPSSVRMGRMMILNDLYVREIFRRRGVGRALLDAACETAKAGGAIGLVLETERTNAKAQRLYDAAGWQRNGNIHYFYDLRQKRTAGA